MDDGMKRRSVTLDEDTWRCLEELARHLGQTRSAVVRLAVRHYYRALFKAYAYGRERVGEED